MNITIGPFIPDLPSIKVESSRVNNSNGLELEDVSLIFFLIIIIFFRLMLKGPNLFSVIC